MSDDLVMVIPVHELRHLVGRFQGLLFDRMTTMTSPLQELLRFDRQLFIPRQDAEDDEGYKQIIPYAIVTEQSKVLQYRRKGQSEGRLDKLRSIGFGGHITREDRGTLSDTVESYLTSGAERELQEEVKIFCDYSMMPIALINDDSNPVGRVHLGVVYDVSLKSPIGKSLRDCVVDREGKTSEFRVMEFRELLPEIETFETWSRFLITAACARML